MHLTIAIASLIGLAHGAAIADRQGGTKVLDFRTYGGDECDGKIGGVSTLMNYDIDQCEHFPYPDPDGYGSVWVLSGGQSINSACYSESTSSLPARFTF